MSKSRYNEESQAKSAVEGRKISIYRSAQRLQKAATALDIKKEDKVEIKLDKSAVSTLDKLVVPRKEFKKTNVPKIFMQKSKIVMR